MRNLITLMVITILSVACEKEPLTLDELVAERGLDTQVSVPQPVVDNTPLLEYMEGYWRVTAEGVTTIISAFYLTESSFRYYETPVDNDCYFPVNNWENDPSITVIENTRDRLVIEGYVFHPEQLETIVFTRREDGKVLREGGYVFESFEPIICEVEEVEEEEEEVEEEGLTLDGFLTEAIGYYDFASGRRFCAHHPEGSRAIDLSQADEGSFDIEVRENGIYILALSGDWMRLTDFARIGSSKSYGGVYQISEGDTYNQLWFGSYTIWIKVTYFPESGGFGISIQREYGACNFDMQYTKRG